MRRTEENDGPPVLNRKSTREDKRRRKKYIGPYNYMHDTVIKQFDQIMVHYSQGEFEKYRQGWRDSDVVARARPSNFENTIIMQTYTEDRFADIRKFLYRIIDHIRQSINMIQQYNDTNDLRKEYEHILEDPFLLMRYYRRRFKDSTVVKHALDDEAQLNVVPILKPHIVEYIRTYNEASDTSIRDMDKLMKIADYNTVIDSVKNEDFRFGEERECKDMV